MRHNNTKVVILCTANGAWLPTNRLFPLWRSRWRAAQHHCQVRFMMTGVVNRTPMTPDDAPDRVPDGTAFGDVLAMERTEYGLGEKVFVDFWSGNPSTAYRTGNNYLLIEQNKSGDWQPLYGDMDWSTIIRWREEDAGMVARVSWSIPMQTEPGIYRVKHLGQYRLTAGNPLEFESSSPEFEIVGH